MNYEALEKIDFKKIKKDKVYQLLMNRQDLLCVGTRHYQGLASFWAEEYNQFLKNGILPPTRQQVHKRFLEANLRLDATSENHKKILVETVGEIWQVPDLDVHQCFLSEIAKISVGMPSRIVVNAHENTKKIEMISTKFHPRTPAQNLTEQKNVLATRKIDSYKIEEGDILIFLNSKKALPQLVGNTGDQSIVVPSSVARVRVTDKNVDKKFLYQCILKLAKSGEIAKIMSRKIQPHLTATEIKFLIIPNPKNFGLEKQQAWLSEINRINDNHEKQVEALDDDRGKQVEALWDKVG